MIYSKQIALIILLTLLRRCNGHDATVQQLTINVQSDDLETAPTNNRDVSPIALKQVQFKDAEQVTSETKPSGISPRISVGVASSVSAPVVTKTPMQYSTTIPNKQVSMKAKPRMAKKEVMKPMYYKIIKRVDYGASPKKIQLQVLQRRQGGGDHRMILRPMRHYHTPHTTKFYIMPSQLKGPKGSKVFLPVVPRLADKVPVGYKSPPGAGVVHAWPGKTPNSFVTFAASAPKKHKGFAQAQAQSYAPQYIPAGHAGHQYAQYPQVPQVSHPHVNSHFGHEMEAVESPYETEQGHVEFPGWSQGGARPMHPELPEVPEWAQHEASFEEEGFSPVSLPHVYPAQFGGGPPSSGPTGVSYEGYTPSNPSIYAGFPQGNQAFAQMQAQYQRGPPPGAQYAVEEQTFDVPPPRGPPRPSQPPQPAQAMSLSMSRPVMGPAQTPGLSASQPPTQMISQSQLQSQYDYMSQFQQGAGDIDYSAYQPKAAQVAPNSNTAQTQHAPPAHTAAPENPKHYPALSSIQDYSPNYLREAPAGAEYYQHAEENAPQPWAYQPSQIDHSPWAQQSPQHNPNLQLQAAYAWKQRSQDGRHFQVAQNVQNMQAVQESRTEVTKIQPSPAINHHYARHAPVMHEVVKKQGQVQIQGTVQPQRISAKDDESSDEDDEEGEDEAPHKEVQATQMPGVPVIPQKPQGSQAPHTHASHVVQVAPPSPQKESMISNGWTPIINN